MKNNHLTLGLSRTFTQRIRQYLLFLEVTGHIEVACGIANFLTNEELLSFISTSHYFMELGQISSIQIRLLKAKVQFYENPKVQPISPTLWNFVPMKIQAEAPRIKRKNMKEEHQLLKKFNKEVKSFKEMKRRGVIDHDLTFEKSQQAIGKKIAANLQENVQKKTYKKVEVKSDQINKKNSSKKFKLNQLQNIKKVLGAETVKKLSTSDEKVQKGKRAELNPYLKRLTDIEYEHAKQDYERRKQKRLMQASQKALITRQTLRQMAEVDPCSREIYYRIYEEEKAKEQRQNVSRLKMKSYKPKTEFIPPENVHKVVKQSLVSKLFSNVQSIFKRQ